MVHLTVCSYHVTYLFQSESTLYSCLIVKEILFQNRCNIWHLSNCSRTRTHKHLVRKQILNSQMHFTDKYSQRRSVICPVWLNGWVFIYYLSGCGFESHCNPNDNSLACATNKMKSNVVSMCVMPVKIKSNRLKKELKTSPMLDHCSQRTFINSELGKKLRIEGIMITIKIKTLNWEKGHETEAIFGLKVSQWVSEWVSE